MSRLWVWRETARIIGWPLTLLLSPQFVFNLLFPSDRSHMAYQAPPKFDILAVIEHYGARVLSGNGEWRKATCPIHEDSNPSASVNEDEGYFRCHGCDFSGDAIDVISDKEGLDFRASLAFAKEHFGDGATSAPQQSSSLMPKRTSSKQGRRNWTPPWGRF
ncbi:CHC2 zinc finger domain-containing protein [Nocardioides massiliensis]|uniref:Zinc finger CHC2-type domain-containing protein n=1 Tax=Nocardioides massiliensis TaxID=1325935 RepID=A0ABT9NJU4_9ACTN|nr:CHC2 zinc finger domain-containing protein [Nocardioides massiliensis]MDP9820514.1 hypothetical protein [Nocardioides massiliensis]